MNSKSFQSSLDDGVKCDPWGPDAMAPDAMDPETCCSLLASGFWPPEQSIIN